MYVTWIFASIRVDMRYFILLVHTHTHERKFSVQVARRNTMQRHVLRFWSGNRRSEKKRLFIREKSREIDWTKNSRRSHRNCFIVDIQNYKIIIGAVMVIEIITCSVFKMRIYKLRYERILIFISWKISRKFRNLLC